MPSILTIDELYEEIGAPSQDPEAESYTPKSVLEDVIRRVMGEYADAARAELLAAKQPGPIATQAELKTITTSASERVARGTIPSGYLPFAFDKVRTADGTKLTVADDLDWWASVSTRTRYRYQISGRSLEVLPKETTAVEIYLIPLRDAIELVLAPQVPEINEKIKGEASAAIDARRTLSSEERVDAPS